MVTLRRTQSNTESDSLSPLPRPRKVAKKTITKKRKVEEDPESDSQSPLPRPRKVAKQTTTKTRKVVEDVTKKQTKKSSKDINSSDEINKPLSQNLNKHIHSGQKLLEYLALALG